MGIQLSASPQKAVLHADSATRILLAGCGLLLAVGTGSQVDTKPNERQAITSFSCADEAEVSVTKRVRQSGWAMHQAVGSLSAAGALSLTQLQPSEMQAITSVSLCTETRQHNKISLCYCRPSDMEMQALAEDVMQLTCGCLTE